MRGTVRQAAKWIRNQPRALRLTVAAARRQGKNLALREARRRSPVLTGLYRRSHRSMPAAQTPRLSGSARSVLFGLFNAASRDGKRSYAAFLEPPFTKSKAAPRGIYPEVGRAVVAAMPRLVKAAWRRAQRSLR